MAYHCWIYKQTNISFPYKNSVYFYLILVKVYATLSAKKLGLAKEIIYKCYKNGFPCVETFLICPQDQFSFFRNVTNNLKKFSGKNIYKRQTFSLPYASRILLAFLFQCLAIIKIRRKKQLKVLQYTLMC